VTSRLALFAATFALALLVTRAARADGPFDGKWSMSPMSETFTVQQWVQGCGPAPVNGNAGGGGTVSVVQEGDELVIMGGRVFRTNQCWDPTPALQRVAHSANASGRAWSTRCATPPSDPRRATITTNVSALSDTQIVIIETGRYELNLADGKCIADVKRSSTLNLIARAGTAPSATTSAAPAPTPTPTPTPTPPPPTPTTDCSAPGDPARLEVRPSRKLMKPGETFAFKATVADARGCPTTTATTWTVRTPDALAQIDNGKVTLGDGAADGEIDVEVTAAGKSTHVTIVVASPAKYDELLKQSGLDSKGEQSEPSVAVIATGSIGATSVRAEDGAKKRRLVFIGVVSALVIAVGVIALVGARRSKRAAAIEREAEARHAEKLRDYEARRREKEAQHAAQMKAHLDSVKRAQEAAAAATAAEAAAYGTMVCPSCRREYPAGAAFCSEDANRLIPLAGHEDVLTGPAGGICPTCKRGYNPGVKVCPNDGDELVPRAMHASRAQAIEGAGAGGDRPMAASRGKICPTCGDRFEGSAGFCGKDGTALVLLN
jgi:hypothetical protein